MPLALFWVLLMLVAAKILYEVQMVVVGKKQSMLADKKGRQIRQARHGCFVLRPLLTPIHPSGFF
jgi:hypothetical protein